MKVSYVLLAHEAPEALRPLIETLLASGSDVYVHHDANSPHNLRAAAATWELERFNGHLWHAPRVKVSWGEWTIVQATLNCLNLARQQGYNKADYFMLLSGSCMPIKPTYLLADHLAEQGDLDYIEVVNARENRWVTGGIQEERWEKYHYINWRTHPKLFSYVLELQRKCKIKRKLPLNHTPFMGSQWWCLRTKTIDAILKLIDKSPQLATFYRRTWVPDELFFQTMVGNLIPQKEISGEILTRYKFNSWGIPRVYYDDDLPELVAESTFFARKISHRAPKLKKALSDVCAMSRVEYRIMMNDASHEYAISYKQKQLLEKELKDAAWFGLATSQENQYDYIKSIPNPMLVIVSANEKARKNALDELRTLPDTAVYGDILDGEKLDFGGEITSAAGYQAENVELARKNWHLFLGELAFRAKGKTFVFSLDKDPVPYLNVLRWKSNLTVIMLDDASANTVGTKAYAESVDLPVLYMNSQLSHVIGSDAHCKYVRMDRAVFSQIVQKLVGGSLHIIGNTYKQLSGVPAQNDWPSLKPVSVDRYEFLKSIPNAMVLVYAANTDTASKIIQQLRQYRSVVAYQDALSPMPTDRKSENWHYYLGDLCHAAGSRMVAITLEPRHVSYLETLRWKTNLAVVVIDEMDVGPASSLAEMQESKMKQVANSNAMREIKSLLKDKHCQAYYLEAYDPDSVERVIEDYRKYR